MKTSKKQKNKKGKNKNKKLGREEMTALQERQAEESDRDKGKKKKKKGKKGKEKEVDSPKKKGKKGKKKDKKKSKKVKDKKEVKEQPDLKIVPDNVPEDQEALPFMDTPFNTLGLGRVGTALGKSGMKTFKELRDYINSGGKLKALPGFGARTIEAVEEIMIEHELLLPSVRQESVNEAEICEELMEEKKQKEKKKKKKKKKKDLKVDKKEEEENLSPLEEAFYNLSTMVQAYIDSTDLDDFEKKTYVLLDALESEVKKSSQ